MSRISELKRLTNPEEIRTTVEAEYQRTGGVFRLAPTWVGRPGIIIPGRRMISSRSPAHIHTIEKQRYFI